MKDAKDIVSMLEYAFGNNEFSLEAAYHDCKLVFDGITDDASFQEADTGLILYYANEIIYALRKALEMANSALREDAKAQLSGEGTTSDSISRQAAMDVVKRLMGDSELSRTVQTGLHILPSAQSEPIRINLNEPRVN